MNYKPLLKENRQPLYSCNTLVIRPLLFQVCREKALGLFYVNEISPLGQPAAYTWDAEPLSGKMPVSGHLCLCYVEVALAKEVVAAERFHPVAKGS